MRYCVKCGNGIDDGFMFCPECGTKVVEKNVKTEQESVKDIADKFDYYLRKYCSMIDENKSDDETAEKIKQYTFLGAENNICRIQAFLAEAYKTGSLFVEQNDEQYVFWLKKSAETGFADSQFMLALYYCPILTNTNHQLIEKSEDEFIKWLTKAVEQKHEAATLFLADMYAENNKVEALKKCFSLLDDWENPENSPKAKLKIAKIVSSDRNCAKELLNNPSEKTIDELIHLFVTHAIDYSDDLKNEALSYFECINSRWVKKGALTTTTQTGYVPGVAKSSVMSTYDLLTYIQMAAKMEKGYYHLSSICNNIQQNINELNNRANKVKWEQTAQAPQPPIEPIDYSKDEDRIKQLSEADDWSGGEVMGMLFAPTVVLGKRAWDKHKKRKDAKEVLRSDYEHKYNQYLIDKQAYPQKLQEHNNYMLAKRNEEQSYLQGIQDLFRTKADVEEKMRIAKENIDNFYSADVLYPKYRGLIPVVMFCEYIESGRCESIKECINTYEEDVKHNEIVTRLEYIGNAIYSKQQAICELNDTIRQGMSEMNSTLYGINEQLSTANYNLKVQMETQREMADNIGAIKWYEDWKFIQSGR